MTTEGLSLGIEGLVQVSGTAPGLKTQMSTQTLEDLLNTWQRVNKGGQGSAAHSNPLGT